MSVRMPEHTSLWLASASLPGVPPVCHLPRYQAAAARRSRQFSHNAPATFTCLYPAWNPTVSSSVARRNLPSLRSTGGASSAARTPRLLLSSCAFSDSRGTWKLSRISSHGRIHHGHTHTDEGAGGHRDQHDGHEVCEGADNCCAHEHEHEHVHEHGHGHGNGNGHGHGNRHGHGHLHSHHTGHSHEPTRLNSMQQALQKLAQVLWITKVADVLRENLSVCLISLALLLVGAAAPLVWHNPLATTLQTALAVVAFPLTAVSGVLDSTIAIAGGKIDIHVLMALAAVASVFMGNVWEGGLLLTMFSLSHLVEESFTRQALGDVKALRDSNPESALVLDNFDNLSWAALSTAAYKSLPVTRVEAGSYLLVKAGETVPVDGEVALGHSMITVEHLTGEVYPLEKKIGDLVPGGARNLDGMMVVKATKSWNDSTVARIMKITEDAQLNRPVLQRWLDQFGEQYSKVVIALSVALAVLGPVIFKWPLLGSSGVRGSIYRGLALMVSASPCALAVAPLAYATAISACANKGILLRGGEVLDSVSACDMIAFDKTGTLTTGELECKAIEPLHGHLNQGQSGTLDGICCNPSCAAEALAVAAALERGATHPIAQAVLEYSEGKKLPLFVVQNFESFPGKGLAADIAPVESGEGASLRAYLGSLEFVGSSSGFDTSSRRLEDSLRASPFSSELVRAALSVNSKITIFHLEDKLRAHSADVISSLRRHEGLRMMMLTGDHLASAQRVARAVGIDEVYSGLKPEEKLQKARSFSARDGSGGLIMVGDGINDAPALAAATVGVVLAQRASATAVAVADVLLLQDNIDGVPFLIAKAHQTTAVVKQSVFLALFSILVASLPSVLGMLPLWLTVLLHEGGTLLVCLNSARPLRSPSDAWVLSSSGKPVSKFRSRTAQLWKQLVKPLMSRSSRPNLQSGPT